MRIPGEWHLAEDGVTRPTFYGEILGESGDWVKIQFLADCGADQTVLSKAVFDDLGFNGLVGSAGMVGIGGRAQSLEFNSVLRMRRSDGAAVHFRGPFRSTDSPLLDISLLGRDITNLFALVVDRPGEAVCLLSRGEVYQA